MGLKNKTQTLKRGGSGVGPGPMTIPMSNRYELPPRKTRGVPPKRYDPEYEAKRSRYPADKNNVEYLAQMALAFNASLYSNKIPRNVEEALQDPKWKKAMEEEISALLKNETWEKCELPKGKKAVGCMK